MSTRYAICVHFRVQYSPHRVQSLLRALADAVARNWHHDSDKWSDPVPDVDGDGWWQSGSATRLDNYGSQLATKPLCFAFSPVSWRRASLSFHLESDGRLSLSLSVPGTIDLEERGDREQHRMEAQWATVLESRGIDPSGKVGPGDEEAGASQWWEKWNSLEDTERIWPSIRRHLLLTVEDLCKVFPAMGIELDYVGEIGSAPHPLSDPQWNPPVPVYVCRGPVSASIAYDAKPDDNAILAWHAALEEAVRENWRMYRDRWSEAEPDFPTPQWPRAGRSLEWRTQSDGAQMWWAQVPFSPLTWRQARVELVRAPDGMLRATLSCGETPFEEAGDREQYRMRLAWQQTLKSRGIDAPWQVGPEETEPGAAEWWARWHSLENTPLVWAQNCQCLRHIIDRLCRVFPVSRLELDDRLRENVTHR